MSWNFGDAVAGAKSDVLKGLDAGGDFLTGPFKTDQLLAGLEAARIELATANEELAVEEDARDLILADLRMMGAKTIVLTSLATEIALIAPPVSGSEEEAHLQRQKDFYDPLGHALLATGGVMLAAMLPGMAASTIKMVSMGRFLSKASKGKTLLRFSKVAKGTAVLATAIFLVETIIKMIHAEELNAEIKASREELREKIAKANRACAKVSLQRSEAEALRSEMLSEAGVKTVQEFLISMNQAIADVSAQAALVTVARNLLQAGQGTDLVTRLVQLDPEIVARIDRRLGIERALVAGETVTAIADETGADPFEVRVVDRVLAVRGDAARGFGDDALARRHGVTEAVADQQIEIADTELEKHWDGFPDGAVFADLARATLIPEDALRLLAAETLARADLWAGQTIEDVAAAHPDIASARIEALADDITDGRALVASGDLERDELAVKLRLPAVSIAQSVT